MMETVRELTITLGVPLTNAFTPQSRIYWLYLAGALVLAFFVYAGRRAEAESAQRRPVRNKFLAFCFPKTIYGHKSAIVDYKYYVINSLLRAFGLIPIVIGVPVVADATAAWLERLAGPVADTLPAGPFARLGYTFAVLVALDLGLFVAHYLQHRVPVLWEFHKVHHSAQVLTPITLYRMHPVDDILSGVCTALTMGVAVGAFAWGLGGAVGEVLVSGVNLGLFLFYVLGYNLRHSHIWLAYPGWLAWLLVSPAQHQIHHSSAPVHFNRNMGFVFSFWDRTARTLYVPKKRETLDFGIGGGEDDAYDGVVALYLLPFKKAAGLLLVSASNG